MPPKIRIENNIPQLRKTVDNEFKLNPGDIGIGFDGSVRALKIDASNNIFAGGLFTYYSNTPLKYLVKLDSAAQVSYSFTPQNGLFSGDIRTIAQQSSGKIVVGGLFSSYNGETYRRIIRFNTDYTVDNTFNSSVIDELVTKGFNSTVLSIASQPDDKLLVGGFFTSYNNASINLAPNAYRFIRLSSGGDIDNNFNIGTGFNNTVLFTTYQSDNKILVGGNFTSFNETLINRIARLNTDGSLDTSFDIGTAFNGGVRSIVQQSDGKLIIGGNFTSYNGVTSRRIIRINNNGTIDNTFNVGSGFNSTVLSLALDSNNKIIVGGFFTTYNGSTARRIIRLETNGSVDPAFSTGSGFDNNVYSVVCDSNNRVVVGGDFLRYNSNKRRKFAIIDSNGSLI